MNIKRLLLIFICTACLHAEEPFEKQPSVFELQKHTETKYLQDSYYKDFKSWILNKNPTSQKKALLTSTVTKAHYPIVSSIIWYKAALSESAFSTLLSKTYLSSEVAINVARGNYTYTPDGAFWVDFANGQTFGGGFRGKGNVQEERMFDEFPILPDLAFVLNKQGSSQSILPQVNGTAQPFIVTNAGRNFDVSAVPYGSALDSISASEVKQRVVTLNKPFKIANIIGLAAIDFSHDSHAKYSMSDLKYMTQAAYLGDMGALKIWQQSSSENALIVNTGQWGAGAFKNSLKMVIALQILAAEMAFSSSLEEAPQLVFYGIQASAVTPIKDEIETALQSGTTPLELLQTFLKRQKTDPSWAPQQ